MVMPPAIFDAVTSDLVAWRLMVMSSGEQTTAARHIQTYVGSPRLYLGDGVFTETDGKPSANADADSDMVCAGCDTEFR